MSVKLVAYFEGGTEAEGVKEEGAKVNLNLGGML